MSLIADREGRGAPACRASLSLVGALLLLAPTIPAAAQTVIVTEDFAKPISDSGWTVSDLTTPTIAWTVDATPATIAGGAFHSAPYSLNFNNGSTYGPSVGSRGRATSPGFFVGAYLQPAITFWCNYRTETTYATQSDRRIARIVSAGNGAELLSAQLSTTPGGRSGSNLVGPCAGMGVWHQHALDLQPGWGWVRVQFEFDSGDDWANWYEGWFLDDISLVDNTPPTTDVVVASLSFANPTLGPGWTVVSPFAMNPFDNGNPNVGWGVDATPASVLGSAPYLSPPYSLNFNDGSDFDPGNNHGLVTSPGFYIGNYFRPKLIFWCNYETETSHPGNYDRRVVRILGVDGTELLATRLATVPYLNNLAGPCDEMGTWHEHTLELSATWGWVRLQFEFDSVDDWRNDHAGWFIDDISLVVEVPQNP